jgi:hypothetical protein
VSRARRPEHRDHVEHPPPNPLPDDPEIVTLPAGTAVLRIFSPEAYGATALTFRRWGPANRFDHQRSPIDEPEEDPERGIWYGSPLAQPDDTESAFETCLRECFQSLRRVDPNAHLARVRIVEGDTLRVLSLVDGGAIRAGSIAQMAWCGDARKSQAWSRWFYETPGVFGEVDGLLYRSMYNGALNVALYERASAALEPHPAHESLRLDHPALYPAVVAFAVPKGWSVATAEL